MKSINWQGLAALCLGVVCHIQAQEWTRFRGPNGTGISETRNIPTEWTEADFNWKVALPGSGHSSPVIWGQKIFLTSCDERAGRFFVSCFSTIDGKQFWQKEFPLAPSRKHNYNTLASSTPTVDAERVYVCRSESRSVTLFALDHQGELVWEKNLGPFRAQHGSGTSPILHDGMVVFANEQDGESFLIALDAKTGETRWKTPRNSAGAAYSTPCVFQASGAKPVLIFNSEAHGISAVSPDSGQVIWEFPGAFDKRSVSSPVIAGDMIIGSCGSGGGGNYVVAVRPAGSPEAKPEKAYDIRRSAPYVPTSIYVGNRLFLWSDPGIVSCVDAPTGTVKWQERVGGNFFGSPVWVEDRLYCISTTGEVVVIAASDRFELLARNPLGEPAHSTPAVADGQMFFHTVRHLISIGGKKSGERAIAPAG